MAIYMSVLNQMLRMVINLTRFIGKILFNLFMFTLLAILD